ncbi:S9 family peptidase [Erythrobacter sp. MTPC3]|uniref:S9 family peptidase n=1 Tax=Erythrobacter sp. MTPC3 TaxID=3056564 RepID=UPI0036F27133
MTIEDVLQIVAVDRATIAPHSNKTAISVQRPAGSGEVYGRNAYEIDPSRNDIWLVSPSGDAIRNLTNGRARGAGYWCPYWSPNGRYLAMLSTNPEGAEPFGGNNVRLYIWDSETDVLKRADERAIMTQTRYGSPLNEMDLRISGKNSANVCRENDENAPFLWLADDRLLAVMMPPGQKSAHVDRYAKFYAEAAKQGHQIRAGEAATVSRSDSGGSPPAALQTDPSQRYYGDLVVIDVAADAQLSLGRVPAFPMFGALTIALSPGGNRAAVLAPRRAIPPHLRTRPLPIRSEFAIENALGLITLDDEQPIRWVTPGAAALYPLAISGWAADGTGFLLRARSDASLQTSAEWMVDARTGELTPLETAANFETQLSPPCLDETEIVLPENAQLLDRNCERAVWQIEGRQGTEIGFSARGDAGEPAIVMRLNNHLSEIAWSERRMIDYSDVHGNAQQMAVMFPPDYDPQQSYPTLFWVYGGYSPRSVDNFFFDPQMSAFYNMQLYASRGYVVVIPSMPIPQSDASSEPIKHVGDGVIPAINHLVTLGITDNARVGVFGQSFGGFSVYALTGQSNRFAAAAGLAGLSQIAVDYGTFDPTARGFPGIEQDMSASPQIYEAVIGLRSSPGADAQLYQRNSPLTYTGEINTPLLLIHGEHDIRGGLDQAEALYSSLYREGKTARLLRYWGENHSLANSPANVRDISRELIEWFDMFLMCEDAGPCATMQGD